MSGDDPRCPVCGARGGDAFETFGAFRLLRCAECDLVYSDPMHALSGDDYADLYSRGGHHEEFVSQLGIGHRRFFRAHRARPRASGGAAPSLLDIGCSTGVFVDACRARGFRAVGVEHDGEAVRVGRALFPRIDVVHGDLATFVAARPDARFDYVTLFEVVEHVSDPRALVRDATALLRPGGTLVIFVPNRRRTPALYAEMVDRGADVPPHHLTKWSQRAAARLLHTARLDHVHTEDIGKYRFPWLPPLGIATRVRRLVVRRSASPATAEPSSGGAPASRGNVRYDGRAARAYTLASDARALIDRSLFWPADVYWRLAGYERDGLYAEGHRPEREPERP